MRGRVLAMPTKKTKLAKFMGRSWAILRPNGWLVHTRGAVYLCPTRIDSQMSCNAKEKPVRVRVTVEELPARRKR